MAIIYPIFFLLLLSFWIISEIKWSKPIRIPLGILTILSCVGVAYFFGFFKQLEYNSWYGIASKNLIDTTISEIENGNVDVVIKELKSLQKDFHPTYEYRARYDELVNIAVEQMKNSKKYKNSANNQAQVDNQGTLVLKN
jgi:hypothetical protein